VQTAKGRMTMPDLEKVIKGLESQLDDLSKYADADEVLTLTQGQAKDILALLKEQETEDIGRGILFLCKTCGYGFDDIFVNDESKYPLVPRYCPNCGRKVKRDDI